MPETGTASAVELARAWLSRFRDAASASHEGQLLRLLGADSHWRNLCGLSWDWATYSGRDSVARALCRLAPRSGLREIELELDRFAPRASILAGQDVTEATFRFRTTEGPGIGVVRLRAGAQAEPSPEAWTLFTTLDMARIADERQERAAADPRPPSSGNANWLDLRREEAAFAEREPEVLIVGGGHAGISAAVELKRLGLDALIVDRMRRVGDNWRLRYHGLKLHNKTPVNHMLYMPFPETWPDFIPKDKIANWLEAYVELMELNFWTQTHFEQARYDDAAGSWVATVTTADGVRRDLRPKHIVMATSVSGAPNIPDIATLGAFRGPVLHSSRFSGGKEWAGTSVAVFGTGTSAHDICQDLHAHGARTTMVQRSPTLVVNVDPSAQLYDALYLGPGPDLAVRDLLNASVPIEVVKRSHKIITDKVKELDAPLLDALDAVGFRLDFGEDGTGWPLKYRTRGGGYYFNVGCSELIAAGDIGLLQASAIETFEEGGIRLRDGSALPVDLVVLATGYKGPGHLVSTLFGTEVAQRIGPVWGFDPVTQELRNMWTRTRQPGLWFTGGAFSQCRIYSRYIALQIDAIERGRLDKAAPEPAMDRRTST